jgi:hypothetical protein
VKNFVSPDKHEQLDEMLKRYTSKQLGKQQLQFELRVVAGRDALRQALLAMVPQIDELQKKRELMKQTELQRTDPGISPAANASTSTGTVAGTVPLQQQTKGGEASVVDQLPPLMGGHSDAQRTDAAHAGFAASAVQTAGSAKTDEDRVIGCWSVDVGTSSDTAAVVTQLRASTASAAGGAVIRWAVHGARVLMQIAQPRAGPESAKALLPAIAGEESTWHSASAIEVAAAYHAVTDISRGGSPPDADTANGVAAKIEAGGGGRDGASLTVGQQGVIDDGSAPPASAQQGVNPGRKSTLPVHALVHAFHCIDDNCVQKTCPETKGVLKRMRVRAVGAITPCLFTDLSVDCRRN